MSGKSWGSLTAKISGEYRQVSSGESHGGTPSGKFLPGGRKGEYATNVAGSHGGTPSGKFLGSTKGNTDLPTNRTKGVDHGGYKGK